MRLMPVGIQKRTVTAILGAALVVFALFCLGLILYQRGFMEARVRLFLTTYANMITAGVEVGNQERAAQILNSFKSNPQILRADIILSDGSTLAKYPANIPALGRSEWSRADGVYVDSGTADLVQSFSGQSAPAHVFIRVSLALMKQRERQMLAELALAVVLILGSFAILQFLLLQRWVVAPLSQLAAIAETAGKQGDYSRRMPDHDRDEFGQLGKSFNALLDSVEQREKALRQLANFQRSILSDAAYAIISTDREGRITSFNPAAERMFGWKADELVGKATPQVFHKPEEIAARAAALSAKLGRPLVPGFEMFAAEASELGEAEWTAVRKDGCEFPMLLSVTALRDEGGEILGFLGMTRDIAERKLAEAKLREREAQYRLLFENMVTGFALHEVICDSAGNPVDYRYLEVNPAFERLTGLTASELVGRTVTEALPAVEKYWIETFGHVGLTGKPIAYENYFADLGKYYDTWVFSPKPGQFAVLFSDVTDRKQAEESLHESRRLYEELVASVPMGVYRFALKNEEDFAFEYVSDRFCQTTGIARAAVLADPAAVVKIIHPDEREQFAQRKTEAIRARASFTWEGRAVINGQSRWLHIESWPTLVAGRPPFWTGVVFDVTDRRDVEEALHHQHSLLEGALQATADGILAVSSEGRITSYNRQFLELWRVPKEILDANDTAALADYILHQLSNPAAMQTRIRRFDDRSKADTFDTLEFTDGRVYERFSRPQMVNGRVVGRVWSFRDVTARHWAVASLRESEHKFKMLFETANDAILIINEQVFLDCNQRTEIMYGCPRDEIIGESAARFSPKRQSDGRFSEEKIAEKIQAAMTGAPQFFEWIHARADGSLFNAEVSLNRFELRGQAVIQAIVRDITERKQAEAAQRDAEHLYRTLVNTSPDGISLLDMTGRILFASPKALELFYGTTDAALPPGRTVQEFVAAADQTLAAEMLQSALAGRNPPNQRMVMRRIDGHEFVAEVNGALLKDSLGVTWGILLIARDVTERQRQDDELKSKNSELERFTYTVSHDLRSPLITIKGFARALLSDAAAGRTDRLGEDLKRIVTAADKMAELLNDLLELSRVGRIVNPPGVVPMTKIAEEVVELLAGSISQRQARVTVQPDMPAAYGDAARLQEALQNLVENALKFSMPDRIPEIEIGCKTVGDQPAYFVRDHGCGIAPRFHETIFGLFNKLDPRSEGTGIGLALVRRIVEFHGGTVWVESSGAGEGATFYFTLPARKALSPGTN